MSRNAKRHFLRARTLPELIAALSKTGVDLHQIIQDRLRGINAGVLVVGSVAEGTASEASDLDILLLFESAASIRGAHEKIQGQSVAGPSYNAVTTLSHDELIRLDDLELNVEHLEWNVFSSAPGISRWMGRSPDREGVKQSVALLDSELKLLHRIASGWTFAGEAVVQAWRKRLGLEMLPAYLAASKFLFGIESLEDAAAAAEEHPLLAVYLGRGVVENLMTTRTGLSGGTNPSRRTFLRRIGSSTGVSIAEKQLLFPDIPLDSREAQSYLRKVYALSRTIRSELDQQPLTAMAIKLTETKLRYRLPPWLISAPEA